MQDADWLAGHNIAGDITALASAGVSIRNTWAKGTRVLDSLLLSRMWNENASGFGLEDVAMRELGLPEWKSDTEPYNWIKYRNANNRLCRKKDVDARRWPSDLRKRRCALDAWAARLLVEKLYDRSKRRLIEYTHRTAMTLERINLSGAIVDLGVLHTLDTQFRLAREEARDKLTRIAGAAGVPGFTPTNDDHIRALLYDKLGLPCLGKTPTGKRSVAQDTLKGLNHAAVDLLREYNHYDKLYSVSILGARNNMSLLGGSSTRGYLPFRINPLGARTGRRSASNPNSQNWPETVRGMVCSRWDTGKILNVDYARLEVVLLAWLSGDTKLLDYFTRGKGYVDVAKELLGYDVTKESDTYRAIKAIVLGVHYNMQTPTMARNLDLLGIRFSPDWAAHEEETDRVRKLYLRKFAGIGQYMRRRESQWRQSGTSVSYTGRVRHLPIHPGMSRKEHGHLLNQAINFPIQSLAADVTASAFMDIEAAFMSEQGVGYAEYHMALVDQRRKILTRGLDRGIMVPMSQIFNEVHDSLVIDLFPDHEHRDIEIIVESMRAVRSLRDIAPGFDHTMLDVDLHIDPHWRSK